MGARVVRLPGQREGRDFHSGCCDNCRQAADLMAKVVALAEKWAADEGTFPDGMETARMSRLLLRLCGNELRDAIGVPTLPVRGRR